MEEGRISLELDWDGSRIAAVRCRLPASPALSLIGMSALEAAAQISRLFTHSPLAHDVAALSAAEAALGTPADEALCRHRNQIVALEAGAEHLARLLASWPEALGLAVRQDMLEAWRKRLASADSLGIVADLGPALLAWSKTLLTPSVAESSPPLQAPLLPFLTASTMAADAASARPDYPLYPSWAGEAGEVGPLARYANHPEVAPYLAAGRRIAARHAARRADLSDLARSLSSSDRLALRQDATRLALEDGRVVGLSRVETAAGPLFHRMTVDGERIVDYAVISPAAWNFHPDGPFVRELLWRDCLRQDEAQRLGRLLALALDPGCAYDLEVYSI